MQGLCWLGINQWCGILVGSTSAPQHWLLGQKPRYRAHYEELRCCYPDLALEDIEGIWLESRDWKTLGFNHLLNLAWLLICRDPKTGERPCIFQAQASYPPTLLSESWKYCVRSPIWPMGSEKAPEWMYFDIQLAWPTQPCQCSAQSLWVSMAKMWLMRISGIKSHYYTAVAGSGITWNRLK